jgi:benzoylformate decarboxylase
MSSSSTRNTTTGRAAFLSLLEDEGITHLFGNPGTTELPIMDALPDHPRLHYVLGLQESIVMAMADGYARASGRLAACNVHVAPGLGNAMGALFSAKFFGSPVIVTAGQQEQGHGLTEPLLYGPLVPMAQPLVKWAVEVGRLADLPRIVRRAAKVATTPPTGPVFISLPGDILNDEDAIDLGERTRIDAVTRPSDAALDALTERLLAARSPVLVSGHEVATGDCLAEAARLAETLGAPAWQQTVAYGAHFPSEHPAFMGTLGRSQEHVRRVLEPHDLLVCLGADVLRMSVWSETEPLPDGMPVIQLGQRDWEMGKNYPAEIALRCDLGETLRALLPRLQTRLDAAGAARAVAGLAALEGRNWTAARERLRASALESAARTPIAPDVAMMRIVDALPPGAVVVDEGLTAARALLGFLPFRGAGDYHGLASGGLGFGVAGAVGVQLAHPERPVVAVLGDGSAMYGIQALWTAAHHQLPMTYVILNNRGYRILKQRLVAFHDNHRFIGMDIDDPPIDFVALASSMGLSAERVGDPDALGPTLERSIADRRTTLVEVMVDPAL